MTHSALYEAAISQLGYEGSNINNRVLRCFSKVIKLFSISLLNTRYQLNIIKVAWHQLLTKEKEIAERFQSSTSNFVFC